MERHASEYEIGKSPVKRNYWFILLGVLLALLICCCVILFGLAGFLWMSEAATQASPASSLDTLEPTPVLDPVGRLPTPAERRTARVLAESTLPQRDLLALASRLQGISEPQTSTDPNGPPDYEVGDALTFWVHDVQTITFFTTTTTLRYETPHAYWWVEEGYEIPAEDLEQSAERFEEQTYPTSRRYFGSEWMPGVDGDPHVYIFLGNVPGVGGYFSAPDEYPTEIRPHSNLHEMFYINLDNAVPGNDYFDGILAHEFQHMIHWAADRDEDTWVNEGLSELAAQVNGYDVGGSDYAFSLTPDTQLTTWTDLEDSAPHYGASYLFLAYFLERYGEEAIRKLVAEPANGIAGFDNVLSHTAGISGRFEDLFADWLVANYLDDSRTGAGRYGYADLRLEQISHAAHHTDYPVHEQARVHQYAADYILLKGEGDLTIKLDGRTVVPLVGNETHSGEYQWWSNRGDDGDATLTRAFDLSDLEQATLQAWMWYDIEVDYDYAYVEVSTDGGQTWSILENEHTTATNPSGNSYGPAFTGLSGGGERPQWSLERFDLTPFAGREVMIRFEVVTDEALNRPGLALDDISIPELGYSYDVEEGEGGWQAEGWVRVTDHVPQEFLVQVLTIGDEPRVERMALNRQMRGTMTIAGLGREIDRAVLIVSALAPSTTEWATYSYEITQQ
jgi:hypothetical protein